MVRRPTRHTLEELRERVRGFLLDSFGRVDEDPDGDFSLPKGSTRVFVTIQQWSADHHIVRVFAVTNCDVAITPELTKLLATANNDMIFGKFSLLEDQQIVLFEHALLADYLDAKELETTVAAVAVGADDYDDKIQEIAGGRRYIDKS